MGFQVEQGEGFLLHGCEASRHGYRAAAAGIDFGRAESAALLEEIAKAENREALAILARGLPAPEFARAGTGATGLTCLDGFPPGEHRA